MWISWNFLSSAGQYTINYIRNREHSRLECPGNRSPAPGFGREMGLTFMLVYCYATGIFRTKTGACWEYGMQDSIIISRIVKAEEERSMKKILLIFIFTMVTNVCFAADIYTATENGYAKYLHTDSLKAKVTSRTEQESLFEMTYSLICIPDKDTLAKLRNQAFDNKINSEKQTFTFKCSFNKNSNQWNTDGSIWLNSDELWEDSPEKVLYESHGNMPGGAYYGDTPEAVTNRNIIIAAYNYVISHKLIQYY